MDNEQKDPALVDGVVHRELDRLVDEQYGLRKPLHAITAACVLLFAGIAWFISGAGAFVPFTSSALWYTWLASVGLVFGTIPALVILRLKTAQQTDDFQRAIGNANATEMELEGSLKRWLVARGDSGAKFPTTALAGFGDKLPPLGTPNWIPVGKSYKLPPVCATCLTKENLRDTTLVYTERIGNIRRTHRMNIKECATCIGRREKIGKLGTSWGWGIAKWIVASIFMILGLIAAGEGGGSIFLFHFAIPSWVGSLVILAFAIGTSFIFKQPGGGDVLRRAGVARPMLGRSGRDIAIAPYNQAYAAIFQAVNRS